LAPTPPADGRPPEVLLSHTADSFSAAVCARLGCRSGLPKTVYRTYFRTGAVSVSRADLLACTEQHASAVLGLCDGSLPLAFANAHARPPRRGETEKYVLRAVAPPHHEVEMVVMPAGQEREAGQEEREDGGGGNGEGGWSLCISVQVGCAQGCTFCETGRMGLLRQLSAAEIVAQVALARFELGLGVANVVRPPPRAPAHPPWPPPARDARPIARAVLASPARASIHPPLLALV
jgi:23S rRNA (adenine2503-C2)-methyltransferase